VLFSQSGSQGGNHVIDAKLMGHHHIGISLDDHRRASFNNPLTGQIEAEHRAALGKQRRFGAIEVFGGVLRTRHHPASKRDHSAIFIPNREHQAIAKRVVMPASAVAGLGKPAEGQRRRQILPPHWATQQRIPGIGGKANLKPANGGFVDSPFGQVLPRSFTLLWVRQQLFKERTGGGMHVQQGLPLARFLFGDAEFGHLDPGLFAEQFQRFNKLDPVTLHHEVDDAAARFAPVAVKNLLRRADVK
jgi:hypothetical protein